MPDISSINCMDLRFVFWINWQYGGHGHLRAELVFYHSFADWALTDPLYSYAIFSLSSFFFLWMLPYGVGFPSLLMVAMLGFGSNAEAAELIETSVYSACG